LLLHFQTNRTRCRFRLPYVCTVCASPSRSRLMQKSSWPCVPGAACRSGGAALQSSQDKMSWPKADWTPLPVGDG